jgi:hypothetical protein
MAYDGIPDALRREVLERDNHRCRWCGATNRGGDLHHVEYRRGYSYDRLDNLITLCRLHHGFVHGTPLPGSQLTIVKSVAQQVLTYLINNPGTTGSSVWRSLKRRWATEGKCEAHGEDTNACLACNPGWGIVDEATHLAEKGHLFPPGVTDAADCCGDADE